MLNQNSIEQYERTWKSSSKFVHLQGNLKSVLAQRERNNIYTNDKSMELNGGTQEKSKEGPFREDSLIFSVAGTRRASPCFCHLVFLKNHEFSDGFDWKRNTKLISVCNYLLILKKNSFIHRIVALWTVTNLF